MGGFHCPNSVSGSMILFILSEERDRENLLETVGRATFKIRVVQKFYWFFTFACLIEYARKG